MISAGGAVGGLLVGLIAPHFFNSFYEFPLALLSCAALTLVVLQSDDEMTWFRNFLPPPRLLAGLALMALAGYFGYELRGQFSGAATALVGLFSKKAANDGFDETAAPVALAIFGVLLLVALRGDPKLRWMRRGAHLAPFAAELVAVALAGYLGYHMRESTSGYRVMVRNFYGGLKVRDSGPATEFDSTRTLTHGTINHGEQLLNLARRRLATTYYGPNTGVGLAIREKEKTGAIRVGIIGLGTGTLASYGRLGDYYRFYEINPLILRLAHTEFTFVPDCPAKVDVAMGDARLSLERESPENFDILVVDAFSSDSIPVHLLTREAMALFFRHLKPDGILAVHISNRYLDLQPVVRGEAQALHELARVVDTEDDETQDVFGATWVLVTSRATGFPPEIVSNSSDFTSQKSVRLWTDDYSNLFRILK
jgi:SAM-dependent methyltransferase